MINDIQLTNKYKIKQQFIYNKLLNYLVLYTSKL
jgi:hypothetical protein